MRSLSEIRANNHPKLPTVGAEMSAIFREGVNDLRATIHQAMWGSPEHASEPGTPLNPTMQQVTNELEGRSSVHGQPDMNNSTQAKPVPAQQSEQQQKPKTREMEQER